MINTSSLSQLTFAQNYNLRAPKNLTFSSNLSADSILKEQNVPLETHKAYTLVSFEGQSKLSFPEQLANTARNIAESMNTTGECKTGVRKALEKHGITIKSRSAYMAADQLAKNPIFKEVKVKRSKLIDLKPGTIVVWDKCNGHPHGHISISIGGGKEASDCIRDQFTDYGPRFKVFEPKDTNTFKNKYIATHTIPIHHSLARIKAACMFAVKSKPDNKVLKMTDS